MVDKIGDLPADWGSEGKLGTKIQALEKTSLSQLITEIGKQWTGSSSLWEVWL